MCFPSVDLKTIHLAMLASFWIVCDWKKCIQHFETLWLDKDENKTTSLPLVIENQIWSYSLEFIAQLDGPQAPARTPTTSLVNPCATQSLNSVYTG